MSTTITIANRQYKTDTYPEPEYSGICINIDRLSATFASLLATKLESA